MRFQRVVLFGLAMVLLMFLSFSQTSQALIVGSTYQFEGLYHTQENYEGLFEVSEHKRNWWITILGEIIGGSRYSVNFLGNINGLINSNSMVDISSNLVSFELIAYDSDWNNRSWSPRVENTPSISPRDCDIFLVNPDWGAHMNGWEFDVEEMLRNRCVNRAQSTAFANGLGEFQYTIVVNVEGWVNIAGVYQDVNGSTTFGFFSSYDAEGVLIQLSSWSSTHYYNDENTIDLLSVVSYSRVITTSLPISIYSFLVFQLVLVALTLLVGVSCGFWIGKRQRNPQTETNESAS
jgi:hypothetical protein